MKLTPEQIEKISALILENLKGKKLITFKTAEATVLKKIIEMFTVDLNAEAALDKEVEEILSKHGRELDTERIDYRKMFNMVKTKLAKERGIVL